MLAVRNQIPSHPPPPTLNELIEKGSWRRCKFNDEGFGSCLANYLLVSAGSQRLAAPHTARRNPVTAQYTARGGATDLDYC